MFFRWPGHQHAAHQDDLFSCISSDFPLSLMVALSSSRCLRWRQRVMKGSRNHRLPSAGSEVRNSSAGNTSTISASVSAKAGVESVGRRVRWFQLWRARDLSRLHRSNWHNTTESVTLLLYWNLDRVIPQAIRRKEDVSCRQRLTLGMPQWRESWSTATGHCLHKLWLLYVQSV